MMPKIISKQTIRDILDIDESFHFGMETAPILDSYIDTIYEELKKKGYVIKD